MADRRQGEIELEQLTAYLDGELSEGERAEIEQLVARDPETARLLDSLRHTAQRVKLLPRATAPADFAVHVADRLEREALLGVADAGSGHANRPLGWMRPLSLAAGFVLMMTAGWLLWPQVQPRSATETPIAVRPIPRAVPGDIALPDEESESALALKSAERSFASRKSIGPAEKQENDSGLRIDRSNEAPLALAPPSVSGATAKSQGTKTDLNAEYRSAGDSRQKKATSAPTSAPTTTSAPAASQPTTRSAP